MSNPHGAPDDLRHRFQWLLDSIVGLPRRDKENVEEFVSVREWQLALEIFCAQLYEFDVGVDQKVLDTIAALAQDLDVADRYWKVLRLDASAGIPRRHPGLTGP